MRWEVSASHIAPAAPLFQVTESNKAMDAEVPCRGRTGEGARNVYSKKPLPFGSGLMRTH